MKTLVKKFYEKSPKKTFWAFKIEMLENEKLRLIVGGDGDEGNPIENPEDIWKEDKG